MVLVARVARVVAPVVGLAVTRVSYTTDLTVAAPSCFIVRPETPEPPVLITGVGLVVLAAVVVVVAVIFLLAVVGEAGAVLRVMQVTPGIPATRVLQEQQVMRVLPEAPLVYL
jgi:hypothetical protein